MDPVVIRSHLSPLSWCALSRYHRHRFDVVLVWSCDRLARSTKRLLKVLDGSSRLDQFSLQVHNRQMAPNIAEIEELTSGALITFEDGRSAVYSTAVLYDLLPDAAQLAPEGDPETAAYD